MLATGYADVCAPDEDTLTVRRYVQNGLDVFGQPLAEPEMRLTFTRKL